LEASKPSEIGSAKEDGMGQADDPAVRIAALEQRVEALSSTIKTVLTTLMLRGLLTKETVNQVLADAQVQVGLGQAHASAELAGIKQDLPHYMRQAMGPEPDEDDHDH
jgi:hypothetical protein